MNIKNTKKEKNEDIYYLKYLKYKNKYLQLKNIQIGGDKPFISNINAINLLTDPDMETYLNPIYGLIMCESGYIINNYYLKINNLITTEESKLIEKISKSIPGSVQPTNNIMSNIKPIDIGRYIAIKYINKDNKLFTFKDGRYKSRTIKGEDSNKLINYITKMNKWNPIDKIDILYFHILLYCLWWVANNDEGINKYYDGIKEVLVILNPYLEAKEYHINNINLVSENAHMGSINNSKNTIHGIIPSNVARNESSSEEPSPHSFEEIVFKIVDKPFKIFNQEQSKNFCENGKKTYPDCGEVTARNLINLICFKENKFDIGILQGFGAIEELKQYYSVFSNFELQSLTEPIDVFGEQLNARDAWSKLIIEYANTNLVLLRSCEGTNQQFELNAGLALDGQRSNFLQLIKNLLPNIEDFSSIKTSSIESINDNSKDGIGVIEVEHNIYRNIVIYCLTGHYYMEFKNNNEVIKYDHLNEEKIFYIEILLNKSINVGNYIYNKFNSELLVKILNKGTIGEEENYEEENDELNSIIINNSLKEKLFELSITDQYDSDTRRRIYIDVDIEYFNNINFNNIIGRVKNIEEYIGQYRYCCNDFIFLEKIPLLKHLNVSQKNKNITNIDLTLLSSIVSIGNNFLYGCSSLTKIDLTPLLKLKLIGNSFLDKCSSLIEIDLTSLSKVELIGDNFLYECSSLTKIDLTQLLNIVSIGNSFLLGCSSLTEIDLTQLSKIKLIGNSFLYRCSSLSGINLTPLLNIVSIGNNFLCKCNRLEEIDLTPLSKVELIRDSFLLGCSSLTGIDLTPLSKVELIGDSFLQECTSLTEIDLTPLSKVELIRDSFLEQCSSLKEIKLSQKIQSIQDGFLFQCSSLRNIDLTQLSNIKSIGNNFLYGCSSLTEIDLTQLSKLESIGNNFLSGCSSLTEIDLTPLLEIESFGRNFLANCSSLTNIKCTQKQSKILKMNNNSIITIID